MFRRSFIVLIFLLSLICFLEAKTEIYDQTVSLGYSCQVAWQLEHNGLRTLASPFDWFHTPFDSLLAFIANKGINFLDLDKIAVIGPYPGDPAHLHVVDVLYGIISYHDFVSLPYLGNYNEVKAKYTRRVNRFFKLLNSHKRVLFIRQGDTKSQIEYLDHTLHSAYPNLSYAILALNDSDEYKQSWKLPRIRNFHMPQILGDWQGNYPRWKEILSHFSITSHRQARSQEERW